MPEAPSPMTVRVRVSEKDVVKLYTLRDVRTYVGSHFASTLSFESEGLKVRHVILRKTPWGLILRKRNPHNRVVVNGVPLLEQERILVTGDVVRLGLVTFEFLYIHSRSTLESILPLEQAWRERVENAASHLVPHTERIDEALMTRLQYRTHLGTLEYKRGPRGDCIEFAASVPPRSEGSESPIIVQKQRRFLVGFFQTLGELEIDNKEIDDAFYIDALEDDLALVRALALPLRAFIETDVRLTIAREELRLTVSSTSENEAILDALFSLWCTTCDFCAGFVR